MPGVTPYRRIGIIGSGRVASALGLALAGLSVEPLALWSRDPARCAAAVTLIGRAVAAPRLTDIAETCEALAAAGVDNPVAPLVRAALENGLGRGMAGLSGPLLRGDEETIAGHISALRKDCPLLLPPYQAMGLATLDALERLNGREEPSPCRPMLEKDR